MPSRLSRDAVEGLLAKYVATATWRCPTLRSKHVSPHVLRHTSAMQLLQAGVDTSVIALWLGHETVKTTQIYLHADQGARPCPHRTSLYEAWALPPTRLPPRVLGGPLIMPIIRLRSPPMASHPTGHPA